jgi:thioredoxin reductase
VLRHVNGSADKTLKADIVFVVGGVKPFVSVLRNAGIITHRQGCVIVDDLGRTNVEGVFAAGGCASTVKDIIPACVGDGAAVATCARLYLAYGS